MKRKLAMSLLSVSITVMTAVLCVLPVMAEQLNAGGRLLRGNSIYSDNKNYELAMQDDGNLVLYDRNGGGRAPLWSTQTDGTAVVGAVMQEDGNLVLYKYDGKPVWASQTHGSGSTNWLSVQDDGNLVIYRRSRTGNARPVWASNTVQD
jgi:pseudomonalisin